MNKLQIITISFMFTALAGCGGGGTDGPPPGSSVNANPPAAISVTFPVTGIQNLGAGVYERIGSVVVTDQDGNPVPDGTRINLNVIDSVMAVGTITPTDTISGPVVTDNDLPLLADGVTPTSMDAAYVQRGGTYRFIEPNDLILLFNAADADKVRRVASKPLTNTQLDVTSSYTLTYPNATFDGVTIIPSYIIGASLLGANVNGAGGTVGYTITSGGVGQFTITYPADIDHINTSCGNSLIDTRSLPLGSAKTYFVAAAAEDSSVVTIDQSFCFSPIAGGTIELSADALSASGLVTGTLRDGGDSVPIPFAVVTASAATVGGTVTADVEGAATATYITDAFGQFVSNIGVTPGGTGDTAIVTFKGNRGAIATVDITSP